MPQQTVAISQESILPGAIKQRHLVPSPTQKGTIYYGKDGNSFTNLSIGKNNQFLGIANSFPAWFTLFIDLTHPYKIQFGTASITLSSATTGNTTVTFTTAFTTACSVILVNVNNSTNDPSTYTVNTKSVSKTGFTVYLTSTVSTSDTITVAYFAVGY